MSLPLHILEKVWELHTPTLPWWLGQDRITLTAEQRRKLDDDGWRVKDVPPCTCPIHGTRASGIQECRPYAYQWKVTVYRYHCCGRVYREG